MEDEPNNSHTPYWWVLAGLARSNGFQHSRHVPETAQAVSLMDQRMTHFPHEKWMMGQLKMLMKRSTSWQRTLQSKTGALINRHSTQSPTLAQIINIQKGCLAFNMQSGWLDDLKMCGERSKCWQGTRQSKVGVNWIIAPSTGYIWWSFRDMVPWSH